jgi:uracil-DNA glycosylase family 4
MIDEFQLLQNRASVCRACALHENRTRGVPGTGPVDARIVIIGEAPGKEENSEGKPFIGRSGMLLNRMLEVAGISRGDCFVTNMVKCWPGEGNPDPLPDEIEACRPWLDGQLALIKPRGVITFGKYSTNKFIEFPKKGAMGRVQGWRRKVYWDETHWAYVMPLYHPAYVARGMSNARTSEDGEYPVVVAHLKKFAEIVNDERNFSVYYN